MIKLVFRFALSSIFLIVTGAAAFAQQSGSLDNFSNAPVVTVGGFVDTIAAVRGQKSDFEQDRLPDAQMINNQVAYSTNPGTHNRMNNNPDFANESEIHIKVGGINEFGMKYGAVVELQADVSTPARKTGFNADKSYIFTESRMGKFELGSNIGANQKMKVGPSVFARAAGGINGRYLEYINLPMLADSTQSGITSIGGCNGYRVATDGTVSASGTNCDKIRLPRFILIPQSPIAHGGYAKGFYNRTSDNDYNNTYSSTSFNTSFNQNRTGNNLRDGSFGELEDANKVSYYTPRISGWQLGLSYTPDTGNSGTSAAITGDNSGDVKNVVDWGLNYSNNFGNLGFALSGTGEVGKFEQLSSAVAANQRNNLNAYDVGVMITYFGFTLGGSYGSWGKSLQPKSGIYSCDYDSTVAIANQDCTDANYPDGVTKFKNADYWTGGIAYQFGPVAASVTYLQSNFQNNKYKATSLGLDYRMAKGFMPYLEVTQFSFDSNQAKGSGFDQSLLPESQRQIRDNSGYVVLTGVLFAF